MLAEEGPLYQQPLGERLRVDRTTMVAVVDTLGRAGFVERQRDPKDRRAYALRATPQGRRVLARANQAAQRAEVEFLTPIAAADRRKLKQLLRRVIAP